MILHDRIYDGFTESITRHFIDGEVEKLVNKALSFCYVQRMHPLWVIYVEFFEGFFSFLRQFSQGCRSCFCGWICIKNLRTHHGLLSLIGDMVWGLGMKGTPKHMPWLIRVLDFRFRMRAWHHSNSVIYSGWDLGPSGSMHKPQCIAWLIRIWYLGFRWIMPWA
jgi:hypothetical protein